MPGFYYSARVVYSVLFFLLLMTLIVVAKPSALFEADSRGGRPRPFGTGPGRTWLPLGVVTVVLAVLCLYSFTLVDVIFAAT
jgi:hypothetical protein